MTDRPTAPGSELTDLKVGELGTRDTNEKVYNWQIRDNFIAIFGHEISL